MSFPCKGLKLERLGRRPYCCLLTLDVISQERIAKISQGCVGCGRIRGCWIRYRDGLLFLRMVLAIPLLLRCDSTGPRTRYDVLLLLYGTGLVLTCVTEQCMTYRKHMILDACFNITADAVMLCLPIPIVIKAKIPRGRFV